VAGSVSRVQLATSFALAVLALATLALASPELDALSGEVAIRAAVAAGASLLVAGLLARRATCRLGGVTGDVLGATVEVAFTVALVVLTLIT
jgi:adenosylcobinamide-GDP ribazoletransferase